MNGALRSTRVVLPGEVRPATVVFEAGRITAVAPHATEGAEDLGALVLMPGLVDSHVHVNEPGRTEWEGFVTATAAAAAGGVTTIVDMPLNSVPPTTTVAGLEAKRRAAAGRCRVDVAFWGGLVPGNLEELEGLARSGVAGFKAFLVDSGVPEFPPVGLDEIAAALPVLAHLDLPLIVHAELPGPLAEPQRRFMELPPAARRDYPAYLASRPAAAEVEAVAALAGLAERHGAAVHVLHLAAAPAVPVVAAARSRGARLTAETCPHYLLFAAGDVPPGATPFKCAPPIREAAHQAGLWRGLADGTIGMVVSDHSPAPPETKELASGDFGAAWGGISSLQLRLPATWTGAEARGFGFTELAEWLCAAPARLAGLAGRKGVIAPGADADLVAWDPESEFVVDPAGLRHRHPVTPYAGRTLRGVVHRVLLRGAEPGPGRLLPP